MVRSLLLIICIVEIASAAPAAICSGRPYNKVLPLASFVPAQADCSSHSPVAAVTATTTITVYATPTAQTMTVNAGYAFRKATEENTSFTTIWEIPRPANFHVLGSQIIMAKATTSSIAVTAASTSVSTKAASTTSLKTSSSTQPSLSSRWSSFLTNASSVLSTGCSCIDTPKTITVSP